MTSIELTFQFRNQRFNSAVTGLIAFGNSVEASFAGLAPILKSELKDYLDTVAEALARRHGNPWPSGTTSASLSRRSGALLNEIRSSVKVYGETLANIEGHIGTGTSVYGRIQEFGGVIRPKNAKYLTVPLPAALNSDGTPKKKGAREWDNTFVIKSKAGNLLIVQKGIGGDIVPLYVLKSSVTIPARLNMGSTLRAGLGYFVDQAVEKMLQEIQAGLGQ